jgi:hypothetical protein
MQTIDDIRSRVFSIRQELAQLADVEKQARRALVAEPGQSSIAYDLRKIEAQTEQLQAELADLEAQARPAPQSAAEDVPSLEDAEQARDDLVRRLTAAELEHRELASELPDLRQRYAQAVLEETPDVDIRYGELQASSAMQEDLMRRIAILQKAVSDADATAKQASERREEEIRQHWGRVASRLPEGSIERWCAQIRCHARPGVIVSWEERWGPRPTPQQRVDCIHKLAAEYPFTGEVVVAPEQSTADVYLQRMHGKIQAVLGAGPQTVTSINDSLSRKYRTGEIANALQRMEAEGFVEREDDDQWRLASPPFRDTDDASTSV